jgi:hypothetical protein
MILSLVSFALSCIVSLILGLVSLVLGYISYRSVRILVTIKEQVVAAKIVI